jgi:NADP-dependent 3-hydroxy acid dehydrogenase YdfG
MKIVITGTTRGLGKELTNYFSSKGHTVIELNRGDDKIAPALGCDLYINNAYGNGIQIDLVNNLYSKISRMVVMGSVAADYTDHNMPVYSQHKKELKQRVLELANTQNKTDFLLLDLTGDSYNNPELIGKTIDFWLANPKVTCVSFVHGEPNG